MLAMYEYNLGVRSQLIKESEIVRETDLLWIIMNQIVDYYE
jgi:hypothetical protein